jgi:hypothetical protein
MHLQHGSNSSRTSSSSSSRRNVSDMRGAHMYNSFRLLPCQVATAASAVHMLKRSSVVAKPAQRAGVSCTTQCSHINSHLSVGVHAVAVASVG